MTTETRTPEEIERQIERERAGLTDALEDLQDRFSVDAVARKVTAHLRQNGGDIGRSISQSVKENPMAVALTGIGLAWMIFGRGSGEPALSRQTGARAGPDDWHDDHRVQGDVAPRYVGSRGSGLEDPSWVRGRADAPRNGHDHTTAGESRTDAGAAQTIKTTATSLAETTSSSLGAARDRLEDASDQVTGTVSDLRAGLAEGTEAFSDQARERIIAARQRAVEARMAVTDQARRGRARAADLFDDQPLIAGALALAVGAAVAAALPRSRFEDEALGQQSDAAMAEAERVFQEETEKLRKVAKAAGEEAKTVAAEAKADADDAASEETAAETAAQRTKAAAKRVADAAKSEAKSQNLGGAKP